ncbi:hypothetical protein NE850_23095 [Paraburkholderia sp. USG1]|uniref:hypothetical protein n=1 Tax=Paraburkholderia sp. USG1 TaxID=2952268 RepID=UPI0028583AC6|nr:hypothetical protein [Paraburkholderia sp. USG1]MDR8399212.1 hypothetical protein [Paraburkholderia sp. USG1]
MRYYQITVTDQDANVLVQSTNPRDGFSLSQDLPASTWTSLNAGMSVDQLGSTNYAAQRIEVDLTATPLHAPDAKAKPYVKIHGVTLPQISSASNLNGKFVAIYGGMAKGLPLANPQQAGLLVAGQIQQCIGNWIGVEQSLTLYVIPGGSASAYNQAANGQTLDTPVTPTSPANLIFQWSKGQSLVSAILQTLNNAFPQLGIAGAISTQLVWGSDVPKTAYFQTLQQFAQFVHETSVSVLAGPAPANNTYGFSINTPYQGVTMTLQGGIITLFDSSTQTNPIQIGFNDMIGQPTWGAPGKVQLTTVMRGDISVGDFVQLPPTVGVTLQGAYSQSGVSPFNTPFQDNSAFAGVFLVQKCRHVGDSRNADGTAWVSVFELAFQQPAQQTVAGFPSIYKGAGNVYGFKS